LSPEIQSALRPLVETLEALGVRFYLGGSLASSFHGVPRSSIDADVVADLEAQHVTPLAARLQSAYYVDEGRVRAAVLARRSFNAIHLETMFKIDVFAVRRRAYDRESMSRARPETLTLDPSSPPLPVASAEDTILAKLEWFRLGNEVSERQWSDVLGVMRAARERLDQAYLRKWAAGIGVLDLLDRAEADART